MCFTRMSSWASKITPMLCILFFPEWAYITLEFRNEILWKPCVVICGILEYIRNLLYCFKRNSCVLMQRITRALVAIC